MAVRPHRLTLHERFPRPSLLSPPFLSCTTFLFSCFYFSPSENELRLKNTTGSALCQLLVLQTVVDGHPMRSVRYLYCICAQCILINRNYSPTYTVTPARAGNYGVGSSNSAYSSASPAPPPYSQLPMPGHGLQARPVTFAPNVTPVTFNEEDSEDDGLASLAASTNPNVQALTAKLFPPSATPAPPPQRKRCPPGKRLSQGYIPRPPNAFMLFRADFVRQKHVPGSIETDHGSLSKIIGE